MPGPRLLKAPDVCAVPPFRLYARAPVPPVDVTTMDPFANPLHEILEVLEDCITGAAELLIVAAMV